jgi:hypothetical protein
METNDRALLDRWISNWNDLMEFEIIPVHTSAEMREKMGSQTLTVDKPVSCRAVRCSIQPTFSLC